MLVLESLFCLMVFVLAAFLGVAALCMGPFPPPAEPFPKFPPEPPPVGDDVPALIRSLWSTDPDLRIRAADALGRLGPSAAAAIPALRAAAHRDEYESVRKSAAYALLLIQADQPRARREF